MVFKSNYFLFLLVFIGATSCLEENEYPVFYKFTGLDLAMTSTGNGLPEVIEDSVSRFLVGIKLNLFPVLEEENGGFDRYESTVNNSNEIVRIKIWSDQPYNGISAYQSLNTQFLHFKGNYFHVDTILENGAISPTALYQLDYSENYYPSYTHLIARYSPDPGYYRFYVQLTLKDSTQFIDSTEIIKLLP